MAENKWCTGREGMHNPPMVIRPKRATRSQVPPVAPEIAARPNTSRSTQRTSFADRRAIETVNGVPTLSGTPRPMDQALGVHFKKVLGSQTLSANAANDKHLQRLEEASKLIGTIERFPGRLGSVTTMKTEHAFKLYRYLFPNKNEREETSVIKARLIKYDAGARANGEGFFALGITDKQNNVIAYTQGSTVPCDQGVFYYWQYGGVADAQYMKKNYGQDVNPREHGVLNTIHAANAATLNAAAAIANKPALGMIWESEPRGLGDNPVDIQFTAKRLEIHNRAGGRVMMGLTKKGELVNLHLQPSLGKGKDPIALHMMYRPLAYAEGEELKRGEMKKEDASSMLLAWANNFRVEGFAESDVAAAEAEMKTRIDGCEKIVLLPASDVPDVVTLAKTDEILWRQVRDTYGVKDLSEARSFYDAAMAKS